MFGALAGLFVHWLFLTEGIPRRAAELVQIPCFFWRWDQEPVFETTQPWTWAEQPRYSVPEPMMMLMLARTSLLVPTWTLNWSCNHEPVERRESNGGS